MRNAMLGAIAGVMATVAMTSAMRRMQPLLPARDQYPLPPRQIMEQVGKATEMGQAMPEPARRTATMLSHFAFGAAAGGLFASWRPQAGMLAGAGYGALVWVVSYLGWIPAARILRPATDHPMRRNLLMLAAHLVWGTALAHSLSDLDRAEAEIFHDGPRLDAHPLPSSRQPPPLERH